MKPYDIPIDKYLSEEGVLLEYVKRILESNPRRMKIFNRIMEKDRYCWKRFSGPDDIFKWLHNFADENEVYLALVLADNIMYYTLDQIRYLWRIMLTNYVKLFLLDEIFGDRTLPDIEKWFPDYLREKCIFSGYGRAGKSGPSMIYFFRQSQVMKNLSYMERSEFLQAHPKDLSTKERVFLLDDFVGSGNQAKTEWFRRRKDGKSFDDICTENPNLKFVYLALVGCREGKKAIETSTPMKVILGEELDERFRCFSNISTVYSDPNERAEARRVMEEKGRMLYKYPLGYDNMELAIAFFHNTPNNSLPVIWKRMLDGSWYPLFERFE